MLEMKLTIEAPELANALNNLAAALGARPLSRIVAMSFCEPRSCIKGLSS